jgi:hypothetical protein
VITQEQIPTVLEHPVYDTDGNKIGDARTSFSTTPPASPSG